MWLVAQAVNKHDRKISETAQHFIVNKLVHSDKTDILIKIFEYEANIYKH